MTRLANSLVVLRDEVNTLAPDRSKASDGWIGDAAHQSRCSRHNPNDFGVVTALDITDDPDGGCDAHALADQLRREQLQENPHPELAYILSAGRYTNADVNWEWRERSKNDHHGHIHIGVGEGSDCDPRPPYDSTQPWGLAPATPEEAMAVNPSNTRFAVPVGAKPRSDGRIPFWGFDEAGGVFTYNGAPFHGSVPEHVDIRANGVKVLDAKAHRADDGRSGYVILTSDEGTYFFHA